VKITIIATGFVHRDARQPQRAVSVQATPVPLVRSPSPSVLTAAREEVASLVPAKAGGRAMSSTENKAITQPPRTTVVKDAALPMDEDQFDIPTFLRRQGQTEMP
jgi:cell division protein FtsZ